MKGGIQLLGLQSWGGGGGGIKLGGASKNQNRINANKGEEGLNFGNFLITIIECPQIGNV